nr:calcium uptake protein 3, mitochondrial-like [Lytechinus pictus]
MTDSLDGVMKSEKSEEEVEAEDLSLYPISDKEYRFQSFASCEYNGQIYMTPQDFLESVTEGNPRPRIGRFKLTEAQVQNMLKNTPSRKKSTKNLFRSIMDKGIVSYTEYLFLLCILTKPRAGYEIAFKMFDRDGNQRIDRKEFLLMEEIFRKKSQSSGESDSVSWLSHYATDPDSVCILTQNKILAQSCPLIKNSDFTLLSAKKRHKFDFSIA